MKARKIKNGYLIRFFRGEELVSSLKNFSIQNDVRAGTFTVIGATTKIELGFYSLGHKEYSWKLFEGEFEVTGAGGNIGMFQEEVVIHLHATIADINFNAYGGHVRSMVVGATCEVVITIFDEMIERKFDEDIGLNLWNI